MIAAHAAQRQRLSASAIVRAPAANTAATESAEKHSAVTSFTSAYPVIDSGVIASCRPHPWPTSEAASEHSEVIAVAAPNAPIETMIVNAVLAWPALCSPNPI